MKRDCAKRRMPDAHRNSSHHWMEQVPLTLSSSRTACWTAAAWMGTR